MGTETSFQSFPAHVHNVLSATMAESHVVYSKIYPRYKSRKQISFAGEEFSQWLAPHADRTTDVVLLGHSMGGLLSADVILLQPTQASQDLLRHRIVGGINFDVPFLGLHPGVISSGLSSLFRGKDEDEKGKEAGKENSTGTTSPDASTAALTSPSVSTLSTESSFSDQAPSRTNTMFSPPTDPHYNPKYSNDKSLPNRKGWGNFMHFVTKHSKDLRQASKNLVKSHLEFGGAMADYGELKSRYARIRALEEREEKSRKEPFGAAAMGKQVPRVRFVNYYTASTGRPKKPKPKSLSTDATEDQGIASMGASMDDLSLQPSASESITSADASIGGKAAGPDPSNRASMVAASDAHESAKPQPPDPASFSDEDEYTAASKEYFRQMKIWKSAMADLQAATAAYDARAKEQQEGAPVTNPAVGSSSDLSTTAPTHLTPSESQRSESSTKSPSSLAETDAQVKPEKPKKDRKFCMLPQKDAKGNRDPTWVRVHMTGVDEVGAHCGLFFVSDTYEKLVGDTAARIEEWVRDDERVWQEHLT